MVDVLTPAQRKRCMSNIKGKNTKPEMLVRRLAHGMGYRYRLHRKDLPGKPDLVFLGKRKVIFVHGCFWHMHTCKFGRVTPKSNAEFWRQKREATVLRDNAAIKKIEELGWDAMVVWECETKNLDELSHRLTGFLAQNID